MPPVISWPFALLPGLADQHDPALVALSLQNGARLSVEYRKRYQI